jgi:hypothetical protein
MNTCVWGVYCRLRTVWAAAAHVIVLQVFYGREDELQRIRKHMLGDCEKPMVLFGEGGCGKTSLLAKSAGLASTDWFRGSKPISIIRFLGTTPDSSALTPTLVSICQQV